MSNDQCPECGRANVSCICDPRGGTFATYEEKREYLLTHPNRRRRFRSVPTPEDNSAVGILRNAYPDKSGDELQAILDQAKARTEKEKHG
jgi:hypothetical protein